jgi:hypothetical protein
MEVRFQPAVYRAKGLLFPFAFQNLLKKLF